jgi:carbon dioxide concentrating mechanism protein CcmN
MFSRALNFEPINTEQSFTRGDVVVFPGAVIAPGVLLQADIGSQIVIRSGVCIGLGCVIHASGGIVVINDGANLGAGVLLIGAVTIGARACLGAAVTVIDSMVAPGMILESGTLVGDRSRQVTVDDLIDTIPMNSPIIPVEIGPDLNSIISPIVEEIAQPIVSSFVEPIVDSLKLNSNQNPISTFQYPSEIKVEPIAAGVVVDSSGKPWQSCDPNPWDPTNHPPGETTCQVTSKPQEQKTFDPTLFSSQNYSSPYPPYQQQPQSSTIASPVVESIGTNPAPIEPITEPSAVAKPSPDLQPKAVYGQDYVNRMLGKMSGR